MSATKIPIVTKCKRCGATVIVEQVETYTPDPEGELLFQLTKNAVDHALCGRCQAQYNYYSSIGKGEEYLKGIVL